MFLHFPLRFCFFSPSNGGGDEGTNNGKRDLCYPGSAIDTCKKFIFQVVLDGHGQVIILLTFMAVQRV